MNQSILNTPFFLALFIFGSFICDLSAQEKEQQSFKTIFDHTKQLHISGFGGPIVEFSTIANDFAVSSGGGGGVIVNNIFIGAYGIGLSTNHYSDVCYVHPASSSSIPYNYSNDRINFGHGGFWIGGSFKPQEALHLSLSSKLGWGNISFYDNNVQNQNLYIVHLYKINYENRLVATA
ncbi:MAG: hypothetical protein CVT92_09770 [Bacteroidetes bacterium HGW-Bacteroidetes-1]|nr:MAG: hypothetical protein CVT92_09770 [Bacteroidetes bacterium HGW-Bacteroidetes-1]